MTRRKQFFTLILCLLAVLAARPVQVHAAQAGYGDVTIFSPQAGEAVQGLVQIIGTVNVQSFDTYEVAFAFTDDATQTWFQIDQGHDRVIQNVLAEWDTTVLTDSTYNLLLRVHQQNGNVIEFTLEGIRVRNYSTIETSSPAPTSEAGEQQPTATSASNLPTPATLESTPTPLAPNPAAVDDTQLTRALKRGAILGISAMIVVLLYGRSKRRGD